MASMPELSRWHVRRRYAFAFLLSAGLFILHTFVLFELASVSFRFGARLSQSVTEHLAGPAVILVCFLALFMVHFFEAAAWAAFLAKSGLCQSFPDSLYFAASSITALGYGDVVLRPPWRVLGAVLAISGLLMFGCSTAFLFLVMQKIWQNMI